MSRTSNQTSSCFIVIENDFKDTFYLAGYLRGDPEVLDDGIIFESKEKAKEYLKRLYRGEEFGDGDDLIIENSDDDYAITNHWSIVEIELDFFSKLQSYFGTK